MKTTDKTLTVCQKYDLSTLECVGWTCDASLDGTPDAGATEGYHWQDYFRDGEYLGRDKHGIEPLFRVAAAA